MVKSKVSATAAASRASYYAGGRPRTGQRMVLSYNRNERGMAAPAGMDVGQEIEPRGRYMNVSATSDLASLPLGEGWTGGYIEFSNPLVVEHVSTTSAGWKKTVSDMYGGKTGRELSAAVRADGYDAIVTIDSEYGERTGDWFNETVDLGGAEADQRKFRRITRNG